MSTLVLSPRRDWSAVTLREIRDHISDRAADAPDHEMAYWVSGDGDSDYCLPCCEKAARAAKGRVDGGFTCDHDSIPFCETCGVKLDGNLTAYGIKEEIDHAVSYPPTTPENWDDLDRALIDVRGEDMTLAQLRAMPVPADKYSVNRRRETLSIWERVAPIVLADMMRGVK